MTNEAYDGTLLALRRYFVRFSFTFFIHLFTQASVIQCSSINPFKRANI